MAEARGEGDGSRAGSRCSGGLSIDGLRSSSCRSTCWTHAGL